MYFATLSDEEILEFLAEESRMRRAPGVAQMWLEFLDSKGTQAAVVVSFYVGNLKGMSQLPVTVAGLPVIVKVQDPTTMKLVEIIDPRKNGGSWPGTSRDRQGVTLFKDSCSPDYER